MSTLFVYIHTFTAAEIRDKSASFAIIYINYITEFSERQATDLAFRLGPEEWYASSFHLSFFSSNG